MFTTQHTTPGTSNGSPSSRRAAKNTPWPTTRGSQGVRTFAAGGAKTLVLSSGVPTKLSRRDAASLASLIECIDRSTGDRL